MSTPNEPNQTGSIYIYDNIGALLNTSNEGLAYIYDNILEEEIIEGLSYWGLLIR